jgi:hypothetical protein
MPKQARVSAGLWNDKPYDCAFEWPADCFCQAGGKGIVFTTGSFDESMSDPKKAIEVVDAALGGPKPSGSYRTAFFEAFPKNPSTFIRGEGKTIPEAEKDCWEQWQKIANCQSHEFERRGYTNGAGLCKKCNLFKSSVFEPSEKCCICGKNTYHTVDNEGSWYCAEHENDIPEAKKTWAHRHWEEMKEDKEG